MKMDSIVPNCPSGLCVTKQDFLKPDFSVDNFFIEQNVKDTPLDTLRDDLGIYLKVLRSSMIELINEDYADFVNLSTNLVGLDTTIAKLEEPLQKVQTEVNLAFAGIEETLANVKEKLEKQASIRAKKESLANLQHIWETLGKVERMLAREAQGDGQIPTDIAERIAADVNHLLFSVSKMAQSSLIQDIQPRIDSVCDTLNSSLDQSLLLGLKSGDCTNISQCCRIYATIDRIECAESLVREKVLRPVVEEVLTETNLENNTQGLKGVLNEALNTIPKYLSQLVKITTDEKNIEDKSVKGFDFLVNSFWPVVAELIDKNLNFIFSPGNPTELFKHYTHYLFFISQLEKQLTSEESILRLRKHKRFEQLMNSWNLPVYFQIRFQEIATPYELSLDNGLMERAQFTSPPLFLRSSERLLEAIRQCYDESIFLLPVGDKFFKLSLQIISRYGVWARTCVAQYELVGSGSGAGNTNDKQERKEAPLLKSNTSKDLQNILVASEKTHKRSVSDQNLADQNSQEGSDTSLTLSKLVMIHSDIVLLCSLLPQLLSQYINTAFHNLELNLGEVVDSSVTDLERVLPQIEEKIVSSAASEPSKLVKQVSDIPRMYRRTNRDIPSKPCNYASTIVNSLAEFRHNHQSFASEQSMEKWLSGIVEAILCQYIVNVTDVLTNVTKMEESLKKLKKVRGSAAGGQAGGKAGTTGLSDDDKIRLQLYLDVMFFSREVKSWNVKDVKYLAEIEEVVSTATQAQLFNQFTQP